MNERRVRKFWIIEVCFILAFVVSFAQQEVTTIFHLELPKTKPQDNIVTHTGYTLSYNSAFNVANWVAYELIAEETVPVVKRNNRFIPDPLLSSFTISNTDYKNSGYDRGHLAPSADMCFSYQTMAESFYLPCMNLNLLYQQKNVVGGFSYSDYRSSTGNTAAEAWSIYFYEGFQSSFAKNDLKNVRPIRAF